MRNIKVNWIGAFDPVSMHLGRPDLDLLPSKLSSNIARIAIARRTGPGLIFPKFKLEEDKKRCNEELMNHVNGNSTSHGEVGGPSSPDHVLEWMVKQADDAGVEFKEPEQ